MKVARRIGGFIADHWTLLFVGSAICGTIGLFTLFLTSLSEIAVNGTPPLHAIIMATAVGFLVAGWVMGYLYAEDKYKKAQ